MIEYEDFWQQTSTTDLSERLSNLCNTILGNDVIKVLEQTIIKNEEHLMRAMAIAKENRWEGLIIRKDSTYKGKRSNDLLKVKEFFDAEYIVTGVQTGVIRFINDEGLEESKEMLSAVTINHKGFEVGVGSGWTMKQRAYFYDHSEEIIGKVITVQFFEETKNQEGGLSLRFPTVKVIHGLERTV